MASIKSGSMIGGKWLTFYDQGFSAYSNGSEYLDCAGGSWQAGWRAGLKNALKFWAQMTDEALKQSRADRKIAQLGV